MKKIFILLIICLLIGCDTKPQETNPNKTIPTNGESEVGDSMLKEDDNNLVINSGFIEIAIDKTNGSINAIKNVKTGRDFIKNSKGANWSMLVDTKTNDYYETNVKANSTYLISSRNFKPLITTKETTDSLEIKLDYAVSIKAGMQTIDGLYVLCKMVVNKNSNEITVDYQVNNEAQTQNVIVSFTGMIVSGIKDEAKSLDLFWPNKEGKIYEKAVEQGMYTLKLGEQYPSPISMQLVQLFDEEDSLYYYVCDKTREYKEFNFGAYTLPKEYDNGAKIQDKLSLACTQYPYIAQGESKNIWTIKLGVGTDNSWYQGSDSYRNFLIGSGMNREYNKYVEEWTGFVTDTIATYQQVNKTYTGSNASDAVVKLADDKNVDTIVLFGWHEGGFDYKYPDYKIMEGEGYGVENFKAMIDRAHQNDDKVIAYLNAHITAMNSDWGNTVINSGSGLNNMLNSAIKKNGFKNSLQTSSYPNYMYYESYGTDTGYYATCPASDEFITQIKKVTESLAECGIDGLWMDQMMEMPAYQCFDKSHNHKTPATAYGEGYQRMYGAIDEAFTSRNIDYLIFAEGVTDAWIEYIDICGYMWARHLYAPDNVNPGDKVSMRPELTRYTIPAKFLGIDGYQVDYNHAYAYLFGSPLKVPSSGIDTTVTKLYQDNGDIYFTGTYKDTIGLTISNSKVLGSVIVGSSNRIGVQLYNNSNEDIKVIINLDLEALGINGDISAVKDLINNQTLELQNNNLIITIKASNIASLGYEIQE